MNKKKQELDVDFIGGTGPLTKEEEQAISQYLQSKKRKTSVQKRSTQQELGKRAAKRTRIHQ
jgi:hypothetical protein